jgi:hypothetical protein
LIFEEAQANAMAAALLMPRFMMAAALKKYNRGKRICVYGDSVFLPQTKTILQKISDMLGVSHTALLIQLRKYDLFEVRDITEYIEKNLMVGGKSWNRISRPSFKKNRCQRKRKNIY